jgi:transcriptional regulator with XRE-family HTH domain
MPANDPLLQFGARLSALREARGLSQKQLAAKLRISVSTLSRHERGEASPRFDELLALREVLRVNLDFLATGEGPVGIQPVDPRFYQLQEALAQLPRALREALAGFVLEQQPPAFTPAFKGLPMNPPRDSRTQPEDSDA